MLRTDTRARGVGLWAGAAVVAVATIDGVLLASHVLLRAPGPVGAWLWGTLALIPLGGLPGLLGRLPAAARRAERVLVETMVAGGLTLLVLAVQLTVVIGFAHRPADDDRAVSVAAVVAALVAILLAMPARRRLSEVGQSLLERRGHRPQDALAGFGARMSRAMPFDELLLQLAESLRAALGHAGAEIWIGGEGVLLRTVSVPHLPGAVLRLNGKERVVVGANRIAGPTWLSVWLPSLVADQDAPVRVAPATHLGELLGLLLVRRAPGAAEFTPADETVLIELARQLGLALHNQRLDSALAASLAELRERNAELQASRLRIVTAADASRRAIERDLHDGAQQHLVALSVKLGLARELVRADPAAVAELIGELHDDVQQATAVFRELAHGIYPPLLRRHGLGEALRSAARRVPLPCRTTVDLPSRHSEQIEAAVYFCCLEALQNAAKYAGPTARVTVAVTQDGPTLRFAVHDDGAGFEIGAEPAREAGHGFVNMADRLGALGGTLHVESVPGRGTAVLGEIPVDRGESES